MKNYKNILFIVLLIIHLSSIAQITNNFISSDQIVCYNSTPNPFIGTTPVGGTGTYTYLWLISYDTLTWSTAPGINNLIDYQFPINVTIDPIYFRRQVNSAGDFSNSNIVVITIANQPIQNNIIYPENYPNNKICYNTSTLIGNTTMPTGGDGSFTYLWQDSIAGSTWQNAPNSNTFYGYSTPLLTQNTFYRRIAYSCTEVNISNIVEVKVIALPTYTVDIDDSICIDNGAQIVFNYQGDLPWSYTLSDGVSSYPTNNIWEIEYFDYLTPTENSTYTITNVVDANGCEASNSGQIFDVIVFDNPIAFAGYDTVICNNYTNNGLGAAFTDSLNYGRWNDMPDVNFDDPYNPNTNITVDYFGTFTLEWKEYNDRCENTDFVSITFIEPLDKSINYAGPDVFLDFQFSYRLNAIIIENYIGHWHTLNGDGLFVDDYDPNTIIENLLLGDNLMTWTLSNDYCGDKVDTLLINVNDNIIVPSGFSPNSDGVNDKFFIRGLTRDFIAKLWIYNRWGIIVHFDEDYKNNWDGTGFNQEDLPNDTYFYILDIKDVKKFKGSLEIKR